MMTIEQLSVRYGPVTAVEDVSFSVKSGEVLALIGANGAGKSSILKGILGLVSASGAISVAGAQLEAMPSNARVAAGVALSPEGRHVFPQMTVTENLELGYVGHGMNDMEDAIADMFALFPRLKERHQQQAGSMSGGEQQMLAIARALMSKPKVVMLDEPTLGLAPIIVEQLIDLLATLKRRGLAVLLAEQNAEMALQASDNVRVLDMGRIIRGGQSRDLAADPGIRASYLGM
ncbi:MAG: ABC transporter ATP-binding protein [Proteobacteria bacterium]|nr:ABC transporter ATP-binding protein [Pseudomonadota bacterium]